MLSKNNKILIGCLALLLVMSVGYALFSDTITINGSATASGEFELTTTCSIAPKEDTNIGVFKETPYFGVSKNEISCVNNAVTISTNLDYPGAYAWYKIIVKNDGTIKARLKNIEMVESNNIIDGISNFKSNFYLEPLQISIYPSELGDEIYEDYYEPANEPRLSFDEYDFTDKLPPGKIFVYYIKVRWSEDDTTQRTDGVTADYTFKFNYEQATD